MDFHNFKPVFSRIFLAWSRNHNVLYTAKGCFAMLQHSLDSCALVTGTAGLTIPSVFTPHARASERFWEFFTVNIRNRNTRQAYYHDDVQKIQLVFIANCRDETATRQGVQRVFVEKLDEKRHQAQAAHRGLWRPLHVNLAREGVQAGTGCCWLIFCDLDLTLRVSLNEICFFAHVEQ